MNVDPLQVLSKLAAVYNIPACRVTPPFAGLENFDYGLRKALDPEFDWQEFGYTRLYPAEAHPGADAADRRGHL